MSSNSQNNKKMCKSPPKNMAAYQQKIGDLTVHRSPKPHDLTGYELLSTNCTMVGSNNLNLESKISYLAAPQPKICPTKAMPRPSLISDGGIKKRTETTYMVHGSVIPGGAATKFTTGPLTGFPQHTVLARPQQQPPQPQVTPPPFDHTGRLQTGVGVKSPASSYGSQQSGGSNNSNAAMCSMSPSAYSNPSPSYPSAAVSPYNVQISSPANSVSSIASGVAGIKSPVASPQNIRPPTPQPIMQQQAFQQIPVMTSGPNLVQIIQAPGGVPAGYQSQQQHTMLATRQTILAPQPQVQQQQTTQSGQTQSVIKIKPPLNILPKPPPSTTGNKPNATRNTPAQSATIQQATPQQIVLPNQAILPTAQAAGTLVLNQMPLIVQQNTAQGVQLILRPGTPTSGQISAGKLQPQNLILQQGPTQQPAVLIQHGQARPGQTVQQPQQLVRVLTANGVIQGLAPAYIMNNIQQLPNAHPQAQPQQSQQSMKTQPQQQIQQIQQGVIGACVQPQVGGTSSAVATIIDQLPPPKRKPKKKKKNKEPKLDLANIMKLSGIGDDDDVHFESDTSESALSTDAQIKMSKPEATVVITPPASTPTTPEIDTNQLNFPKRIGNIHISAVTQDIGKISQNTSQTNAILEKHFMQTSMSQISVQQSLSDISAINQNLTQIGILNSQNSHNFLGTNLSGTSGNVAQTATPNLLNQDGQGLANFLQALNQNSTFPVLNGQPQSSTVPGLTTFTGNVQTSNYQKIATSSTAQTSNANFGTNFVTNLVTSNQSISSDNVINLPKVTSLPQSTRPNQSPIQQSTTTILSNQNIQNINQNNQNNTILSNQIPNISQNVPTLTNFNLSNPLSNIQVQNFGSQNLFLNQGTNTIIAPNIPNFSGNITINNGLIPNANLTLQNNLVPNFLQTNLVQPTADVNSGFNAGVQRTTGGFKLALSEDGRLILQHDPTLNQDIQSQLLLQSIFGISIPGNNLVLTSVSQPTPVQQPQVKPIAVVEPKKQEITSTKTTSIIQNSIPSIRTEIQPQTESHTPPVTTNTTTPPNNFSYIVNLTPEQLETLKRNGQLTVNGQTIFMHRPKGTDTEKTKNNNKTKTIKKKPQINIKTAIHEHLVSKTETKTMSSVATQSSNSSLISALQAPAKNAISHNVATSIMENKSILDTVHGPMPSNVVCVQPNNSKIAPVQPKIEEPQPQLLPPPQPKIMLPRRPLNTESTIVKEVKKEETSPFENGDINVEQFLNNLNINPTSLGQLISQKLPGGIEHKIVNISPGQTPGQIVAKIDIGMEHSTSMQLQETSTETIIAGNNSMVPPLVSMSVKSETTENVFNVTPVVAESIQTHLDRSIVVGSCGDVNADAQIGVRAQQVQQPQIQQPQQLPQQLQQQTQQQPIQLQQQPQQQQPQQQQQQQPQPQSQPQPQQQPQQPQPQPQQQSSTVYQRIQTIQLTPQKQQLLKNVQLQIQALTTRLQQKVGTDQIKSDGSNVPENEIHRALKLLFVEQQKILATGKIIPNITQPPVAGLTSNVDSVPTQTIPVSTSSKNNNTCLTSLLQQPVVSQIQNQKVYYHHGNQIIAINPTSYQQANVTTPVTVANVVSQPQATIKIKSPVPTTCNVISSQQTILTTVVKPLEKSVPLQTCQQPPEIKIQPNVQNIQPNGGQLQTTVVTAVTSPKKITKSTYSKAQLIEQQMSTDQNGAMNPDVTTPFSSKADACKRLVRYHCYNQPVLSQKDLNKADEIFELTARHFIEKFRLMVNKYKYLLLKESMREVQTSELMMIDRMFLAEEQQSLLKAQSNFKLQNELDMQSIESTLQEMYGESSETTCEDNDVKPDLFSGSIERPTANDYTKSEEFTVKTENCEKSEFDDNHDFNIKCGLNYFSDGSCDSSNFQVYEESPKFDDFIGKTDFTQNNEKKEQKNVESYNTTKIIGNFEIEINNKGCNNQESFTKNFRQKIIDNKDIVHSHIKSNERKTEETFENRTQEENDDYDEWLCIQRELGYYPEHGKDPSTDKQPECSKEPCVDYKPKNDQDVFKKSSHNKRSSSDTSRLETLKKFRVEKHNSKVRKTGGIIGEVKFEVRIEHKKVFPEQKNKDANATKRPPSFDHSKAEQLDSMNKRVCVQNQVQNHRNDSYSPYHSIKQEEEHNSSENIDSETFERSIDEQVQSAIDSILNLQQINSMSCDKPDSCTSITPANKSNEIGSNSRSDNRDDIGDSTFALDEAVKSILS